jgi:hypothetical protein
MNTEPTMPPEKQSFWTTIPGILAQLTALIVALTALFAFFAPKGCHYDGSRSKDVLERIGRGDHFHVVLSKSFHDLAAGETYFADYNPSLKKMFVTGFAASAKQPNVTNSYLCPNIDKGQINLWGHPFSVEGDEIVDSFEGPSGKIYFDDEGK